MALVTSQHRFAATIVGAIAALAMAAAPANAELPDNQCPAVAMSQPFAPWLDFADYVLAPGGSLERGGAPWTLTGGAAVVAGNEPFYVGTFKDRLSLRLPGGSSATTAAMCLDRDYPTLRFFAKRDGTSLLSSLLIEAVFTNAAGDSQAVPISAITNAGVWAPTAPLPTVVNALALVNPLHVAFRFTPKDGSQWSIDDVYVDPYRTN